LIFILANSNASAQIINKVVAKVGNKVITEYDIQAFNPPLVKKIYNISDASRRAKELKDYTNETTETLINSTVMEVAANKLGISVSEADVTAAMKSAAAKNGMPYQSFIRLLEQRFASIEGYKNMLKYQILTDRIKYNYLYKHVVITDKEITEYAKKNAVALGVTTRYDLYMLSDLDEKTANSVQTAFKENNNLEKTLKLYIKSEDPLNEAYLGLIDVNSIDKESQKVLKEAKAGEFTKPVKIDNKYRVYFVKEKKDLSNLPNSIKAKVTHTLQNEKFDKVLNDWLHDQRGFMHIEYMR